MYWATSAILDAFRIILDTYALRIISIPTSVQSISAAFLRSGLTALWIPTSTTFIEQVIVDNIPIQIINIYPILK